MSKDVFWCHTSIWNVKQMESRLSFHTGILRCTLIYFQTTKNNYDCIISIIKKLGTHFQLVKKYQLHKCNIAKIAICKTLFATTRKIMWIITESYLKKENTFHNFKAESFVLWPWLKYFVRNSNCKNVVLQFLGLWHINFFNSVRHLTNCLPRHFLNPKDATQHWNYT